jgi:sphinganine-1-phosphate aldolase
VDVTITERWLQGPARQDLVKEELRVKQSHGERHEIGGLRITSQGDVCAEKHDVQLAQNGRSWSDIQADLVARKVDDCDWRSGRLPIYVYYDNEELLEVSREAYNLYFSENALGQRAFPSLARMENEVVSMSLALFHAPQGACGSFTSGGTESIFLALKAARDRFKQDRHIGATQNIVIPRTAHPAFDKAAHYLGVDVVRVDIGSDLRCDIEKLEAEINESTILIAGSAPCYPYGVYDFIPLLSTIARSRGVWLHVDACLGGFLAPFARDEGFSIPEFDFSLEGVCSLSADLHKFGFAARGASVLLHRSPSFKVHQSFRFDKWPRGTYITDTFLGSRPGGTVASAWAVMQYLGRSGYRKLAKKTMDAAQRLRFGIQDIAGLEVIVPSELNIVVYRSTDCGVDINAVADSLTAKGWFVGRMHEPEALHLALNAVHAPIVEQYLMDVRAAVSEVRAFHKVGTRDDLTY